LIEQSLDKPILKTKAGTEGWLLYCFTPLVPTHGCEIHKADFD
jgi:hypothetical protein